MKKNKSYFGAISIIIGTAVGAGIFALPYAFAKAGYLVGALYLVVLGSVSIILIRAYTEVVLRTPKRHQIVGYVRAYLGKRARAVSLASFVVGITGALVAYTIQVGRFLQAVLGSALGGDASTYSYIFIAAMAVVVFFGLGLIGRIEKYLVVVLLAIVGVIAFKGMGQVHVEQLMTFDPLYVFLPYGVALFALSAASAIPDAVDEIDNKKKLNSAITWGIAIPIIVYIIFTLVVVGVSGAGTTEGAMTGLAPYLGEGIVIVGSLLGIMTMSLAFMNLGMVLKEIYHFDLGLPNTAAWLAAILPPLVVFALKLTSFVSTIAFVGGVMCGVDAIMILLMWQRARHIGKRKPECVINIPHAVQFVIMVIFGAGIAYELYYQFMA
ncbi:MAG: aromatic amino acid transport family protein [Patescibacteria group bacterium]|jgi:tyrosine-specific transport protein